MTDNPENSEVSLPRLGLRESLSHVVDSDDALARAVAQLAIGEGPVGLDAERASGYRYSQRAYLIQVRRHGSGTFLIDPTSFDNLDELNEVIGPEEWILHAATQDLPCLRDEHLVPTALFDTELAGRLLNLPRVGLASLVEHYLRFSMAKEHSAADWSSRPLPESWLEYAALDVEVLAELRDAVKTDLEAAGKLDWALEEFTSLLTFTGPPPRVDPWRRTSGIHKIRDRRALSRVRELWLTRDDIAQELDVTPGKIMRDQALLALALDNPATLAAVKSHPSLRNSRTKKFLDAWFESLEDAALIDDADLPPSGVKTDGPPNPRAWADKSPEAATRLITVKERLIVIAEEHNLPTENLVNPGIVRALAWEPPSELTPESVARALRERGVREWQIALTADALTEAFTP